MSIHLKQTLLDFSYLGKFHSNISFLVFKIVFKTQHTHMLMFFANSGLEIKDR